MTSEQPEHPLEDENGRLNEGLISHSHMRFLTERNQAKILALICRHTDPSHVAMIDLHNNTSTLTVFCTDTNDRRYLVEGEPATVTIEINEGLSST